MKKNTIRKFKERIKGCKSIEDDNAIGVITEALRYIDFSLAEINVETLSDDSDDWCVDKLVRVTVKLDGNTLVFDGSTKSRTASLVSLNGFGVYPSIDWSFFQELLHIKENQELYRIQAEPAYAVETLLSIADKHPSDYAEAMEEKVVDDPDICINGKCLENLFATPKRRKEEDLCNWRKHLKRLNWVMEDGADIVVASWSGIEGSLVLLFCRYCGDCDTIDEVEIKFYGEDAVIAMNNSYEFRDGVLEEVTDYFGSYLKTSCTSIAKDFIQLAFIKGVPFTIVDQPIVNGMDNLKRHVEALGSVSKSTAN